MKDTKGYILYDFTYVTFRKRQMYKDGNRPMVAIGWGRRVDYKGGAQEIWGYRTVLFSTVENT